jgi:hypothetical protein
VSFGERRRAVEFLPWHRTVCGTALSVAPHCLWHRTACGAVVAVACVVCHPWGTVACIGCCR